MSDKMHRRLRNDGPGILAGLDVIARALRAHPNTIRRWIKMHGFPAVKTPDGVYCTTIGLVEAWLLAKLQEDDEDGSRVALVGMPQLHSAEHGDEPALGGPDGGHAHIGKATEIEILAELDRRRIRSLAD